MNWKRAPWLFIVLAPLLVFLVAWNFHLQDDAFISFRYASHIRQGLGAVWNPGDNPSFGFTNLLWTLLLSIPTPFSIETWSVVMSVLALGGNLIVTNKLFSELIGDKRTRNFFFIAFATNHTLLAFGSSGLETALNGLLWTSLILLLCRTMPKPEMANRKVNWLGIAVLSCLVLLSRPDGILLLGLGCLLLTWAGFKVGNGFSMTSLAILCMLILPVILYAVLGYSLTGQFLPIPFYAKATGLTYMKDGLIFLVLFFGFSSLWVPALVFAVTLFRMKWRDERLFFLAALSLVWCLYMVYIGGDFMEFRMMLPVLPVLYLLGGMAFGGITKWKFLRTGVFALLVVSNLFQGILLGKVIYTGWLLPVHRPVYESSVPMMSFDEQGIALKEMFAGDEDLTFAIGNAGIVPFRSGLRFVDVFGLTDMEIARHGLQVDFAPGHRRLATWAQLKAMSVNFLILRCDHRNHVPTIEHVWNEDPILQAMLSAEPGMDSQLVLMQISDDFLLTGLYIKPAPALDAHILLP